MPRGRSDREFLANSFPAAADVEGELAKTPLCVKFSVEVDRELRSIPGYSAKVRQWVAEGMQRENQPLLPGEADDMHSDDMQSAVAQAIAQVLPTIPIKERSAAARHYKKLLKAVQLRLAE